MSQRPLTASFVLARLSRRKGRRVELAPACRVCVRGLCEARRGSGLMREEPHKGSKNSNTTTPQMQ